MSELVVSDRDRAMFVLAFSAYAVVGERGEGVAHRAREAVLGHLEALAPLVGDLELVWGPASFHALPGSVADHAAYLARDRSSGEVVLAIAGTNPESLFGWLVMDGDVGVLMRWPHGGAPRRAAIARGTNIGVGLLRRLVSPSGGPGAGTTLEAALAALAPPRLAVTGHSLGGVLASTMALFLHDCASEWHGQGVPVEAFSFAGPTAGNAFFAMHSDERLEGRVRRVANRLDIVPRAWDLVDLSEVPELYEPAIPASDLVRLAVTAAKAATAGRIYSHVSEETPALAGAVNEDLVDDHTDDVGNFVRQVAYQHAEAYFPLLGAPGQERLMAPFRGRLEDRGEAFLRRFFARRRS